MVPGMESYKDWQGVKGLDVVGGRSFFPHMNDQWQTLVEEKRISWEDGSAVVCLRDDEVCFVDGSQKRITQLSSIRAKS